MRICKQKDLKQVADGVWGYRGYFIHRVRVGSQVGGADNLKVTMYEVAESLQDLRECIGFQRFSSMVTAKNFINARIKERQLDQEREECADDTATPCRSDILDKIKGLEPMISDYVTDKTKRVELVVTGGDEGEVSVIVTPEKKGAIKDACPLVVTEVVAGRKRKPRLFLVYNSLMEQLDRLMAEMKNRGRGCVLKIDGKDVEI